METVAVVKEGTGGPHRGRWIRWALGGILAVLLVGGGSWVWFVQFERETPSILLTTDDPGKGHLISFRVEDQKSGVAEVVVEALQKGDTLKLLSETFPKGTHRVERAIPMKPLPKGLQDGEVRIRISAKDHSWNRGNPVSHETKRVIDTVPPQVAVLGAQHYINQGGAGMVTYQVSEEVRLSGIQLGEVFFPGYPTGNGQYLAFFAVSPTASPNIAAWAIAEDPSGNRSQVGFRPILKAKAFTKDRIQLTDAFLNHVVPYFKERNKELKGTPLEIYLEVNRKQREVDHQEIQRLCKETVGRPLWSGPFLRLPNSKPMASFAQERTYWYNGKEVDRQVHLGVDLASLAQSPVPAANSGRIAFAGPLGIYGNTILIDHGCGLFSMYSHLSRFGAEVGKEVRKGEIIGHTGTTGLAGGDHLHFSMLVHGLFVNPIEWWDEHWIKDNIESKRAIQSPGSEGTPPTAKAPPSTRTPKKTRKALGKR